MPPRIVLAALALALVGGCDITNVGEQQQLFELRALSEPSGYTETPDGSTIRQQDPTDWQTAPVYLTRFAFTATPYPNPLSFGESIRVGGTFGGESGVLIPYRRLDSGDFIAIPRACVSGTLSGFAPSFTIDAGCLGNGQAGLARLLLLDERGRFVSYGDVLVAD